MEPGGPPVGLQKPHPHLLHSQVDGHLRFQPRSQPHFLGLESQQQAQLQRVMLWLALHRGRQVLQMVAHNRLAMLQGPKVGVISRQVCLL